MLIYQFTWYSHGTSLLMQIVRIYVSTKQDHNDLFFPQVKCKHTCLNSRNTFIIARSDLADPSP